jgi:hypothetical protein
MPSSSLPFPSLSVITPEPATEPASAPQPAPAPEPTAPLTMSADEPTAPNIPVAPPFSAYLPDLPFHVICRLCFGNGHSIVNRQCPSCYKLNGGTNYLGWWLFKYKTDVLLINIYGISTPRCSPPAGGGRSSFLIPGAPRTRAIGGLCNNVYLS